jgi:hypothetical protein
LRNTLVHEFSDHKDSFMKKNVSQYTKEIQYFLKK